HRAISSPTASSRSRARGCGQDRGARAATMARSLQGRGWVVTSTITGGRVEEVLDGMDQRAHLLSTVLDAAVTALGADGGLVLGVDAAGDLELVAERGLRLRAVAVPQTLPRGAGVLGSIVEHPRLRRGRLGAPGLEPAPGEPATGQLL